MATHDHRGSEKTLPSAAIVEEVAVRLRAADQRFTPARRALVVALQAAGGPLSIPEILQAVTKIPQSSIYRNLAVLESAGVVTRIMSNDEFGRFELAEDLIGHHHHLLCQLCGAMSDVTIAHDIETQLDATLSKLAAANGFTLDHHRLEMANEALNRPCRCIPMRAKCVTFDLFGHVKQRVDLSDFRLPAHHALHHAPQPAGTFAAGRALATGFFVIEVR